MPNLDSSSLYDFFFLVYLQHLFFNLSNMYFWTLCRFNYGCLYHCCNIDSAYLLRLQGIVTTYCYISYHPGWSVRSFTAAFRVITFNNCFSSDLIFLPLLILYLSENLCTGWFLLYSLNCLIISYYINYTNKRKQEFIILFYFNSNLNLSVSYFFFFLNNFPFLNYLIELYVKYNEK
jgi:hypothetical protein